MAKLDLNAEEKELYDLAKINDVMDIFLFLIGLLIPFTGDLIESIAGGVFDLLLLYWMLKDKDIRFNAFWIFLLELLDLTDFITMGLFDVVGWVEVIPFWVIGFMFLKSPEVIEGKKRLKKKAKELLKLEEGTAAPEEIAKRIIFCPSCKSEITHEMIICESCGEHLKEPIGS